MGWYTLARQLLFLLEPERSHQLGLDALTHWPSTFFPSVPAKPYTLAGLTFANRIGLAAGFDKNADYLPTLAKLGFGFIEVGTVTPRPQAGNPPPRLFRLPRARALINRMGFNNKGVDHCVAKLQQHMFDGIVGVNIGKNRQTALNDAARDYHHCLDKVYPYADYVTVNISSPNTPELRQLQTAAYFGQLLMGLKQLQQQLAERHQRYVPLFVKLAPDLNVEDIKPMADELLRQRIDGVVATNTTNTRPPQVQRLRHSAEQGGLSGRPLAELANQVIARLYAQLATEIPIIGVGGIMDVTSAQAKWEAGAKCLQVYTGLIYRGPKLVRELIQVASSLED
jgi:dihydroorotate dehydrogenase